MREFIEIYKNQSITDIILILVDTLVSIKEVNKKIQAITIVNFFIKAIPDGPLKICLDPPPKMHITPPLLPVCKSMTKTKPQLTT
jgi:hypothetical protein